MVLVKAAIGHFECHGHLYRDIAEVIHFVVPTVECFEVESKEQSFVQ